MKTEYRLAGISVFFSGKRRRHVLIPFIPTNSHTYYYALHSSKKEANFESFLKGKKTLRQAMKQYLSNLKK